MVRNASDYNADFLFFDQKCPEADAGINIILLFRNY